MATTETIKSTKELFFSRLLKLTETDPQIRAIKPITEIQEAARQPELTLDKVISIFLDGYAKRPALGERSYDITQCCTPKKLIKKYNNCFHTITYEELHDRIKALAMSWRFHKYCIVQPDDFVCIMGFSGIDYAVIDLACAYARAVTVPLSSSSSERDLKSILASINPTILASSIQDLHLSVKHSLQQKSIKSIIVFDYDKRATDEETIVTESKQILAKAGTGIKIISLDDLIAFGQQYTFSFLPAKKSDNEKIAMIMHSSGTTGNPKGACITARAMINTWQGPIEKHPRLTVIIPPFNHNMGRNEMYETLNSGGTAYFTLKRDMTTLFEDIRLIRPTTLTFFPRILDSIYQHFQIEANKRSLSSGTDKSTAETTVKTEMRSTYLGDRLLSASVASAPVSAKVKEFIADCFDIYLINGYSTTETASGGLAIDGKINREIVLEYKLRDVPELGYYTTDKPYPRGEFCVKTKYGITQYYKQPEATAHLFDEEGFTLTGDIVEKLGPDYISIIDRRVNILKLPQGEYVALGTLGKTFEANSELIHQIFLYGNSQHSYLLAVIVPDLSSEKNFLNATTSHTKLKEIIKGELLKVGQQENLKSFEIPRDFIIENTPFSRQNGLLSSVNKYLIQALKLKYKQALEFLFEEHDNNKHTIIEGLKNLRTSLSTKDIIIKLLEANLGIHITENDQFKSFYELGGDSLSAVLFSIHMEDIFDISFKGDIILHKKYNIIQWTQLAEEAKKQRFNAVTFDTVHGMHAKTISSKNILLENFIDNDFINNTLELSAPVEPSHTVLLTGGNGFFGHILCLQWLKILAATGGKLVCIIRAEDNLAARHRLDARFIGLDLQLESLYKGLSTKHLEVLAGDISKPLLGLSPGTFERLSSEIDNICHAGALVNHRLSYRHLFNPNVKGTCELIRLAISKKKKSIGFLSTIGVNDLIDNRFTYKENVNLKSIINTSDQYASGYITSKWAGEHLLKKAHYETGININIFRCDMALPDSRYKGQINSDDMLTRLIYSIITTKTAPNSFYSSTPSTSHRNAHYTGIPVDILSNAIIEASIKNQRGITVYNAYNYLQDDISLDTFIDWIESAGYSIQRNSSHEAWLQNMKGTLSNLPVAQKKHSITDMLDAFRTPLPAEPTLPDCHNFVSLVRRMNNGADLPSLSEAYFHEYLSSLHRIFPELGSI